MYIIRKIKLIYELIIKTMLTTLTILKTISTYLLKLIHYLFY